MNLTLLAVIIPSLLAILRSALSFTHTMILLIVFVLLLTMFLTNLFWISKRLLRGAMTLVRLGVLVFRLVSATLSRIPFNSGSPWPRIPCACAREVRGSAGCPHHSPFQRVMLPLLPARPLLLVTISACARLTGHPRERPTSKS